MLKASLARLKDSIVSLQNDANEIMILYRAPGRFRLKAPPLLYSARAAIDLKERLGKRDGVLGLDIDDRFATFVLTYNEELISEKELFLLVDSILTPLLAQASEDEFMKIAKEQRWAKIKILGFHTAVVVTTVYIIYLHFYLAIRWVLNPFYYWAPLSAVAFLIWAHRRPVRRGLGMMGATV